MEWLTHALPIFQAKKSFFVVDSSEVKGADCCMSKLKHDPFTSLLLCIILILYYRHQLSVWHERCGCCCSLRRWEKLHCHAAWPQKIHSAAPQRVQQVESVASRPSIGPSLGFRLDQCYSGVYFTLNNHQYALIHCVVSVCLLCCQVRDHPQFLESSATEV